MTTRLMFVSLSAMCVIATAAIAQSYLPTYQYAAVLLSTAEQTLTHLPTEKRHIPITNFPRTTKAVSAATTTPVVMVTVPAKPLPAPAVATSPPVVAEPAMDVEELNAFVREAVVNIVCISPNSEDPISGTGVIIDPRGVILTNAHVAQYLLLRDSGNVALTCNVRTGSPVSVSWTVSVLYISSQWVTKHAGEIRQAQSFGTGENDYALLRITGKVSGAPLPASFSYLPPDIGSAAAYAGQDVLIASYPAGFLGGIVTLNNLSVVSTVTKIKQVFTFLSGSHDLVSLGGVIVAQSGSSGGAVVNAAKKLIALIATSTIGEHTSERDLHAITPYHINESLTKETGKGITAYLQGSLDAVEAAFTAGAKPALQKALLDALVKKT